MLVLPVSSKQRWEDPWDSLASQLSLTVEAQVLVRDCLRKQCEHHREAPLIWAGEQGGFGSHSAEKCSGGEAGIRWQETGLQGIPGTRSSVSASSHACLLLGSNDGGRRHATS